jgi:hypothetical protein
MAPTMSRRSVASIIPARMLAAAATNQTALGAGRAEQAVSAFATTAKLRQSSRRVWRDLSSKRGKNRRSK